MSSPLGVPETPLGSLQSSLLESDPTLAYIYLTFVALAIALGTVGNMVIIWVHATNLGLKGKGNEFVLNLAVSDLFVTMVADPMCILGE